MTSARGGLMRMMTLKILKSCTLIALISLATGPSGAEAQRKLYSISSIDDQLRVINPTTGATISSVTITLSGTTLMSGNGLATDPTTGKLWALLSLVGQTGRRLVTIDPNTGVATSIGDTGDRFAGLAFASNGTLYGVTGDGAIVPETLYTLNKINASKTFVRTLGNGDDGEAIAFNPTDGLIYHASGNDEIGQSLGPEVFETINPVSPFIITNIPLAGFEYSEITAFTHRGSENEFLMGDVLGSFAKITSNGSATFIGGMDHSSKGLTFLATSGTNTAGVYNPTAGVFFLKNTNTAGGADVTFQFGPGGLGWIPLVGDWNGDGVDTVGVYNPSAGVFFLKNTNAAGGADVTFQFGPGGLGWIPLVGDWNGDGVNTVGVYNPSAGVFFLKNTNAAGGADVTFQFGPGGLGWIPLVGDWNGDGVNTVGAYDPSAGVFFLKNTNTAGGADVTFQFGPGGLGWMPLVGDWNGDGVDTVGVYNPSAGVFFLKNTNTAGGADITFQFGPGGLGWIPLVGDWNGDGMDNLSAGGVVLTAFQFGPGELPWITIPLVADWDTSPSILGIYTGSANITQANCTSPGNNVTASFGVTINVGNQNGASFSGSGTLTGTSTISLNFSGSATNEGQVAGTFAFTTTAGFSGNGSFTGLLSGNTLTINLSGKISSGETCTLTGSPSITR
jgi:hypothetical protein